MRRDFRPRAAPPVGLWDAFRSGWFIVLAVTLLALAAAAALTLLGGSVYTAKTQLSVAAPDLEQPGALSGFSDAAESLASSYSRSVAADAVVGRTAQATGLSRAEVRGRVSATPVPGSPVLRVFASAPSREEAARLANEATTALVSYVRSGAGSAGEDPALEEYRTAAREAAAADNALGRARGDYEALPSSANQARLERAQTNFDVASLRAAALRESYLESGGASSSSELVRLDSRADAGTATRDKSWQKYLFAAGVAGLLVGLALAMLRANARTRHRYTR